MPRFHFNVFDGAALPDPAGRCFPDLPTARRAAIRFAGALLQDDLVEFWTGRQWWIEIADEAGISQLVLFFDAIEPGAAPGDLTDTLARADTP